MSMGDDMLCDVDRREPSALDRYIEQAERDDSIEKMIERVRARNQRIRRLWGIPERDYPPIERLLEDPSLY